MRHRPTLLAAAVLLIATAPAFAATTYVKAGRLLDVESGRLLIDQAIVIEDTRITAIGPAATTPVPAGAAVHDLSTKTVLPGLMDGSMTGAEGMQRIIDEMNK